MKDEVDELSFSIYLVAIKLLYKEIAMSLVYSGCWVTATILNGTHLFGRWDLHCQCSAAHGLQSISDVAEMNNRISEK